MNIKKIVISAVAMLAIGGQATAANLVDYFPSKMRLLEEVVAKVESPAFVRQFSLFDHAGKNGRRIPARVIGSRVVQKPYIQRSGIKNFTGATSYEQTYRAGRRTFKSCLTLAYVSRLEEADGKAAWVRKFYAVNTPKQHGTRCEVSLEPKQSSDIFIAEEGKPPYRFDLHFGKR